MANLNTMQRVLMGMNAVLVVIGLAVLGLAFGTSLQSDLTLMPQHPLFSAGMNCLSTAALSSLLLFVTGRMPNKVKIDKSTRK